MSKAAEALKESMEKPPNQSDARIVELLGEFSLAYEEVFPGGAFSVAHILKWAHVFAQNNPKEIVPDIFSSGYSLGKFLRKHQQAVGVEEAGSYGNRVVYRRITNE